MAMHTARDAFLYALGDLYDGEHHLLDTQQHLFEHATDARLLEALRPHIAQTEQHILTLEEIFRLLGAESRRVTSHAARGMGDAARQALSEAKTEALRDYVIAGALLQIEHVEIISYRILVLAAGELSVVTQVVDRLQQTAQQDHEMARVVRQLLPQLLQTALIREGEQLPYRAGAADDDAPVGDGSADTPAPSWKDRGTGTGTADTPA